MRGLRTRLAVTIVGLVALTVVALGIGTYAFVDGSLRDRLLADARQQAAFNLSVLVPARLGPDADAEAFRASGLEAAFKLRGDVEAIVELPADEPYYTTARLDGSLPGLRARLGPAVDAGYLAYAWTEVGGAPSLVVAGRPPVGATAIWFVFGTDPIERALGQLRLGLAGAALLAVLVALATAGWIAARILRPVRAASLAAGRIAEGDLAARVPSGGRDEFGRWAADFNRMAATLEATVARLEAAQTQNRRFVADVSHELRTPLAALVAEASLIEARLPDLPPDARRAAELLVGDVRRLRTLVEDLMELSRFDAAAERADRETVDLARLVAAIVAARLPAAGLDVPAGRVPVSLEPRRLDRILGNLLDNAREHAPGAPVDVAVRVEPGPVEGDGGPVAAVVTVADRGPGVAPELLPRLFERFVTGDPARGGGSGLGLAIAAEHAALLGARLTAAPRDGGGLVFTLRLPVTRSLPRGDGTVIAEADAPGVDQPAPRSTR